MSKCDLCGHQYDRPSDLKGICPGCCQHLGGGRYSCKGLQQEAKQITQSRQQVERRRWR